MAAGWRAAGFACPLPNMSPCVPTCYGARQRPHCIQRARLTRWKRCKCGLRRDFGKPYLTTLEPSAPAKTEFGECCVSTRGRGKMTLARDLAGQQHGWVEPSGPQRLPSWNLAAPSRMSLALQRMRDESGSSVLLLPLQFAFLRRSTPGLLPLFPLSFVSSSLVTHIRFSLPESNVHRNVAQPSLWNTKFRTLSPPKSVNALIPRYEMVRCRRGARTLDRPAFLRCGGPGQPRQMLRLLLDSTRPLLTPGARYRTKSPGAGRRLNADNGTGTAALAGSREFALVTRLAA